MALVVKEDAAAKADAVAKEDAADAYEVYAFCV